MSRHTVICVMFFDQLIIVTSRYWCVKNLISSPSESQHNMILIWHVFIFFVPENLLNLFPLQLLPRQIKHLLKAAPMLLCNKWFNHQISASFSPWEVSSGTSSSMTQILRVIEFTRFQGTKEVEEWLQHPNHSFHPVTILSLCSCAILHLAK